MTLLVPPLAPPLATATNKPFPYVTERQLVLFDAGVRPVQVMPSGLVITLYPSEETATNNPFPYVTDTQVLGTMSALVLPDFTKTILLESEIVGILSACMSRGVLKVLRLTSTDPKPVICFTKAVVAILVELSSTGGVGAVGVPVKAGEAILAFKAKPGTVGEADVPERSPVSRTNPLTVEVASGAEILLVPLRVKLPSTIRSVLTFTTSSTVNFSVSVVCPTFLFLIDTFVP